MSDIRQSRSVGYPTLRDQLRRVTGTNLKIQHLKYVLFLPRVANRTPLTKTPTKAVMRVLFFSGASYEEARLPLPSEEGTTERVSSSFTGKPGPESGIDCRMCAIFARQRGCTLIN